MSQRSPRSKVNNTRPRLPSSNIPQRRPVLRPRVVASGSAPENAEARQALGRGVTDREELHWAVSACTSSCGSRCECRGG